MINQLLKIPGGWQGERPVNLVPAQDPDTYVYAGDEPLTQGTTIGLWDGETGEPLDLDLDAYKAIRPLGNATDGAAVQSLDYHGFMGHAPRNLEPGRRYPAAEAPFDLEIRHKWTGSYWTHRAEMHGDAGARDPSNYTIGAYTDTTYTTWIWPTTGAFLRGPSEWQVDAEGEPLEVWYKDGWDGYQSTEKQDWYIAVLNGPSIEGKATLPADLESVRYLFWEHNQGWTPPPDAEWVDTGLTIISQAGQAYRLSGVPSGLTIGQALRLGPTAETKLKGYWSVLLTPSDYILVDPFKQVAVGSKVWKWE